MTTKQQIFICKLENTQRSTREIFPSLELLIGKDAQLRPILEFRSQNVHGQISLKEMAHGFVATSGILTVGNLGHFPGGPTVPSWKYRNLARELTTVLDAMDYALSTNGLDDFLIPFDGKRL